MNRARWRSALAWGLGPLFVAAVAALAGRERHDAGRFFAATASLSDAERAALEAAPSLAVANVTWAFGSAEAVKTMLQAELARLPDEDPARARALVRLGAIEANPDGQAAAFAAACAAEASLCDDLRAAVEREARLRFVPPGDTVPASLGGGHPPPVAR